MLSLRLSFILRLLPVLWLSFLLLAVLPQHVVAQQEPTTKAPVTIVIDGTESPETLKKLLDSVSAQADRSAYLKRIAGKAGGITSPDSPTRLSHKG